MRKIGVLALLFIGFLANAQNKGNVIGTIDNNSDFQSKYVTARNVDVWLPSDYSNKKKY